MNREAAIDAMVETEVADALRPYEGIFTEQVLDEMRRMLRTFLRKHPSTAEILERLAARSPPDESGKEEIQGFKGALAKKTEAG